MRAVVTVTGTDKRGIIAKVSGFLFERDVNIEDISQTVLGEQFAMIMMTETGENCDFMKLKEELEEMGKKNRHERAYSARRHFRRDAQYIS